MYDDISRWGKATQERIIERTTDVVRNADPETRGHYDAQRFTFGMLGHRPAWARAQNATADAVRVSRVNR